MSLHAALAYAARGFSVIPANGKLPHFYALRKTSGSPGWRRLQETPASTDVIRAWYDIAPEAGVAIVTGTASGIVVADIERPHVHHPQASQILDIHTPLATTPSGGRHAYFAAQTRTVSNRRVPWGDVKADGGYVIAPPDALEREWLISLTEPLAPAESLEELLSSKPPKTPVTLRGISPLEVVADPIALDEAEALLARLADWDARPAFVQAVAKLLGIPSCVGEKFHCILPGHQPDRRPSANLSRAPDSGHVLYTCWQDRRTYTLAEVYAAVTARRPFETLAWSASIHATWKLRLLLRARLIVAPTPTRLALPADFPTRFRKYIPAVEELFDVRTISKIGPDTALAPVFLGPWVGRGPETAKELRHVLRSTDAIHRSGRKHGNAVLYLPGPPRASGPR